MNCSAAAILPLFCALVTACNPAAKNRLVVGMELNYPPFEMTDPEGHPAGLSVDLADELATYLGKDLEIKNLPFDGLIPALKTGKIDVIISSMTATPERAQSIDFSEPYLHTGLCLLVGINSDVHSVDDLNRAGRTVVVKKGTTGHTYAAEHLKEARVLVLDKENACVLEVAQGKADAFIYDQMSVLRNAERNLDTTRPLLKPFREEAWAIGVRKGNDDLRERVNAFLENFRDGGGFDDLGDKWLEKEKENFEKLGVPFVF